MSTDSTYALVRIRRAGPYGKVEGAGGHIGNGRIVTCAHVVEAALALDGKPPSGSDTITVEFSQLPDLPPVTATITGPKPRNCVPTVS